MHCAKKAVRRLRQCAGWLTPYCRSTRCARWRRRRWRRPWRGRRRHHIAAAESRRTSTTLDFTLGALTCSRSAPWPHLKLEQTAEVWPNSQSGEQELNVNCRAGAMRRECGDGWRKRTIPRSIRIGLVQFPVCNICYNQRLWLRLHLSSMHCRKRSIRMTQCLWQK